MHIIPAAGFHELQPPAEAGAGGLLGNPVVEGHPRHLAVERITLDGLDIESLRVYAEALSGRETSREMATTLHTATRGNPFFVKQIVALLTNEPGDESDEHQMGAVPLGAHALVEWQLRRLTNSSVALLEIACAIGRDFGLTLLTRASEQSADELFALRGTTPDDKVAVQQLWRWRDTPQLVSRCSSSGAGATRRSWSISRTSAGTSRASTSRAMAS